MFGIDWTRLTPPSAVVPAHHTWLIKCGALCAQA
jgi:hypothetical protein